MAFPYRDRKSWEDDGNGLDLRHVLFREDLTPERLLDRLRALARLYFPPRLPATAVKTTGLIFDPPTVNVCTFHSAKGLEFPIVFCSMTDLFPDSRTFDGEDAAKQAEAAAARLLYVGMTRARDQLYVTYTGK